MPAVATLTRSLFIKGFSFAINLSISSGRKSVASTCEIFINKQTNKFTVVGNSFKSSQECKQHLLERYQFLYQYFAFNMVDNNNSGKVKNVKNWSILRSLLK